MFRLRAWALGSEVSVGGLEERHCTGRSPWCLNHTLYQKTISLSPNLLANEWYRAANQRVVSTV
jgi:hypothetical protein